VVAYSGSYPQRGILDTEEVLSGSIPKIAATP
jgi:hypothetical protein